MNGRCVGDAPLGQKDASILGIVRCRAQATSNEVADVGVRRRVFLHQPIELVGPDPGELDVVRPFEPRCGEVAVHLDEVVELAAIIRDLDLLRPIYAMTSAYGHFGRELPEFTWERTDRAEALKAAAGV